MTEVSRQKSGPQNRTTLGPYDVSEVDNLDLFIDFGALKLPSTEQLEVRLDIEDETGRIVALSIDYLNSVLQLQAFAAPKSEGVWHEIRAQLAAAVVSQGGTVEERHGTFGPELVSRLELKDEKGKSVGHRFARFVGVDGPRWFLRGVIGGAATTDSATAVAVDQLFRQIVVDRGDSAVPPKELLELRVPQGVVVPPRATK
jgi:hypothetical protein